MRDVFDVLAGDILELMLEAHGRVDRELPVHAAPQRIDTAFTPSPGASNRLRTLGIIGWMASGPCAFECFHNAPTADALREVAHKHLAWHRARRGRSRHPKPLAQLWVICAARPTKAMRAVGATASAVPGVYEVAVGLVGMRIVVIRELAETRETLLVRMMGRDQILRRAIAEFDALPANAPERRITAAVVEYGQRTTEEESAMSARTDLLRQRMDDFFRNAREIGQREGAAASFEHLFAHRLQRPLTKAERASLRRHVDTLGPERVGAVVLDLPVESLARWLRDPDAR